MEINYFVRGINATAAAWPYNTHSNNFPWTVGLELFSCKDLTNSSICLKVSFSEKKKHAQRQRDQVNILRSICTLWMGVSINALLTTLIWRVKGQTHDTRLIPYS